MMNIREVKNSVKNRELCLSKPNHRNAWPWGLRANIPKEGIFGGGRLALWGRQLKELRVTVWWQINLWNKLWKMASVKHKPCVLHVPGSRLRLHFRTEQLKHTKIIPTALGNVKYSGKKKNHSTGLPHWQWELEHGFGISVKICASVSESTPSTFPQQGQQLRSPKLLPSRKVIKTKPFHTWALIAACTGSGGWD